MRDAEFIRLYAEFGFRTTDIAREYEVHPDTVRNILKGRSFRPEGHRPRTVNARKLTPDQVRFVRAKAAAGYKQEAISQALGGIVKRGTVRQLVNGQTYRDVV